MVYQLISSQNYYIQKDLILEEKDTEEKIFDPDDSNTTELKVCTFVESQI